MPGLALMAWVVAQEASDFPEWWINYGVVGLGFVALISGKALVPFWTYAAKVRECEAKDRQISEQAAEISRLHELRVTENRKWSEQVITMAQTTAVAMEQSSATLDAAIRRFS